MSWLPALSFAGNRWWLPLSRPAADLVAALLLEQDAPNEQRVAELALHMRDDPPLAIYAALVRCQVGLKKSARSAAGVFPCNSSGQVTDHESCGNDPQMHSLASLARDLVRRLPALFASGDAFLGLPLDRDRLIPHWEELQASFIRMSPSAWLEAADQWLTVAGPQVPDEYRDQWPTLIDDSEPMIVRRSNADRFASVKLDLSLLARKLRRAQSLGTAFGTAIRAAKQSSLKQFAYGLSHEINNPLANINARAQGLLNDEVNPTKKIVLQKIIDQSMRAHEMVADLMFYSHPPVPTLGDVNLVALLAKVAEQVRPSVVGRGIEIRDVHANAKTEIKNKALCEVVSLTADRAMLVEAIRALVRNSIEAIGCDGRVELECCLRTELGKKIAVILVRDTGPGLSDEAKRHAFDPYFSGREAGRGLGVGLCRVERIATLHGGGVSLISGPAGCTARLWIPAKS